MLLLAIYNLDFGFGALNIIIIIHNIIILNPSFKFEDFLFLIIFSVGCSVVSYKKKILNNTDTQYNNKLYLSTCSN